MREICFRGFNECENGVEQRGDAFQLRQENWKY